MTDNLTEPSLEQRYKNYLQDHPLQIPATATPIHTEYSAQPAEYSELPPPYSEPICASAPPLSPQPWIYDNAVQNKAGLTQYLHQSNWTNSLATHFIECIDAIPMRYFVLDDSGSMSINDGQSIIQNNGEHKHYVCSRWSELCASVEKMYTICSRGNIRSAFVYLNGPTVYVPSLEKTEVQMIALMNKMTGGGTPLCQKINEIADEIEKYASTIRSAGKKVSVTICTDGQPSDGDIRAPLFRMKQLPVFLTLRLCTNEEAVVEYWNQIDRDLELQLDVVDDYTSEAVEIYKVNPWLCYSQQLHTFREFGVTERLLDLLDEQPFTKLDIETMRAFIGAPKNAKGPQWRPYCPIEKKRREYIRSENTCVIL